MMRYDGHEFFEGHGSESLLAASRWIDARKVEAQARGIELRPRILHRQAGYHALVEELPRSQ